MLVLYALNFFILGVQVELTTGAFRNGYFVMEKMTAVIVLMNFQSTVQNAMKMEISSARTNVVYQSKLPLFMNKTFQLLLYVIYTESPGCIDVFF